VQHAYTATTISHPPAYKGTQVVLNVWQPFVEPHDFSLAQLWVMNTGLSFNPGSSNWLMNSIEVGWQVYSDLYGDKLARLFVYWTVSATPAILMFFTRLEIIMECQIKVAVVSNVIFRISSSCQRTC